MAEPEMKGEEPVECEVYPDREQTNDHRQGAVIERVKCRRKYFHPRVTGQPDCIETQGGGSLNRGRRSETPMLINQPDDWLRAKDQTQCRQEHVEKEHPHTSRRAPR